MEIMERLCLRDAIAENTEGHEDPRSAITTESEVVIQNVAECEKQLAVREAIFTKGSVLANAKTMAPADWWDMYGLHLPILSRVAKSVLAQVPTRTPSLMSDVCACWLCCCLCPAPSSIGALLWLAKWAQVVCASGSERNWSVYGRIKSKERSALQHEKSDTLVYCHEALHLRNKLQKVGFKQKIEEWVDDSDSDSNESSGEEDYAV
jgi:hypothetical protein